MIIGETRANPYFSLANQLVCLPQHPPLQAPIVAEEHSRIRMSSRNQKQLRAQFS
jgi:hypothetical protein